MPRVRTTKSLAKRIDLQYFTRLDSFRKWRLWLSVGLALLGTCWVVYAGVFRTQSIYTKGPLSAAHAGPARSSNAPATTTLRITATLPLAWTAKA